MSKEPVSVEMKVPASAGEIAYVSPEKDSHYVVHVELINPICYAAYKRGYLRVNAMAKPEVKGGVLHICGYGMPDFAVPMGNVVYYQTIYIWVAHFDRDDCHYSPYNYPLDVDDPLGEYVDKSGRVWGTLHEDGHIERYGI